MSSLDQLPETRPQRDTGDSQGKKETRDLAKARQRSQLGSGATAFLRARPVDSARTIPASEFVTAGKIFLGIEELLAARCPCCGEAKVNTRHARLCHRSGAQMNQHQPLVHAFSRTLKSMSIRRQVESGAPFHANRDVNGHRYRDGWPPRCYGIRVSRQIDTPRRHVCGPTSGGPRAGRQRGSKRTSCFHFRDAQAQPLRSPETGVLGRAQLQTRHPHGVKLWAPRQRRQRPDRSGNGEYHWKDGRIVPINSAERRVQGAPIPKHFCDHSGRDFAQSSSI